MVGGEGGGNDRLCSSVQNETVCDVIQKKGMWMSVTILLYFYGRFQRKEKMQQQFILRESVHTYFTALLICYVVSVQK